MKTICLMTLWWMETILTTGCVVLDSKYTGFDGYFVSASTFVGYDINTHYYTTEETLFHFSDSLVRIINIFSGQISDVSFPLSKIKASKGRCIYYSEDTSNAFVISRSQNNIQLYKYNKKNRALKNYPQRRYNGLKVIDMDELPKEAILANLQ